MQLGNIPFTLEISKGKDLYIRVKLEDLEDVELIEKIMNLVFKGMKEELGIEK